MRSLPYASSQATMSHRCSSTARGGLLLGPFNDFFTDRSHTARRLQTTRLPAQEASVVKLRKTLLLPLDDLLAVTREFLCPQVSRSGLGVVCRAAQ